MRAFILALILVAPSSAFTYPTACDLVTKADVTQITGIEVDGGEARDESECAGLCEGSNGSTCIYRSVAQGTDSVIQLEMLVPPFAPGDWTKIDEIEARDNPDATVADLPGFDAPTHWFFRYNYGFLHYVDANRLHMMVWGRNIGDGNAARQKAVTMANLLLQRFKTEN